MVINQCLLGVRSPKTPSNPHCEGIIDELNLDISSALQSCLYSKSNLIRKAIGIKILLTVDFRLKQKSGFPHMVSTHAKNSNFILIIILDKKLVTEIDQWLHK